MMHIPAHKSTTAGQLRPPQTLRSVIEAAQERASEPELLAPQERSLYSQATTPLADAEKRLNGLVQALLKACEAAPAVPWYAGGYQMINPEEIRRIIKENT